MLCMRNSYYRNDKRGCYRMALRYDTLPYINSITALIDSNMYLEN